MTRIASCDMKIKILAQHDKQIKVNLSNEWGIVDMTVSYGSEYVKQRDNI